MATRLPTADFVRSNLSYDPGTGALKRRIQSGSSRPGQAAGTINSNGYVIVRLLGRRWAAHRLAWLYCHGAWPAGDIDHINGNKLDNRIANLRDVTRRTNRENQRVPRSDNLSSGVIGVAWSAYHAKWKAHIRVDGVLKHLRYCDSKEEAEQVYLQAKRKMHAGCTI